MIFRLGCAAIIASVAYFIRNRYLGRLCKYDKHLTGKAVIITGANSGIGLALAEELALKGATIILACRDRKKLQETEIRIKKKVANSVVISKYLDLTNFQSITNFCEDVRKSEINIFGLVNNAGIFYAPPSNTIDNFEITFQTNYLGLFLLTILLLPSLRKSKTSRIVNVSTEAHLVESIVPQPEFHHQYLDTNSNRFKAYQYSKFCVVLFSYKLKSLLENSRVTVHCVDPGNTETNIFRNFPQLSNVFLYYLQKPIRIFVIKTPYEAAQSLLYALLAPDPGFYIKNLENIDEYNINIHNPTLTDTLWHLSRTYCSKHLTSIQ